MILMARGACNLELSDCRDTPYTLPIIIKRFMVEMYRNLCQDSGHVVIDTDVGEFGIIYFIDALDIIIW